MVDMVYFLICLAVVCFCCTFLGWYIGVEETKKKYMERLRIDEQI